MAFGKQTTSYGTAKTNEPPLTPFDRARLEWDNRIGSAHVQAFHWRVTALAAIAGMLGLGIALTFISAHKKVQTYIIEIDRFGQPGRVQLAGQHYEPTTAQAGYFVAHVVRLVRSRPLDPVVMRERWQTAYSFLTGDAIRTMNAYAERDSGLDAGTLAIRTVAISNILQKSKGSFQVRWVETTYEDGQPQSPQQHTGLFHIRVRPPEDEAEILCNPLGIYITSFSWSREFTEPVAVQSPSKPESESNEEQPNEHPQ